MPQLFPLGDTGYERYGKLRDPYEAFTIDDMDESGPASEDGQAYYVGLAVDEARLRGVFALISLCLVIVAARAAFLQVLRGSYYAAQAEGNRLRSVYVAGERGVMFDRTGVTLVRNVPSFGASVMPNDLPSDAQGRAEAVMRIAEAVGMTPLDVENTISAHDLTRSLKVVLNDSLTHEQAVMVEIEAVRTPALSLFTGSRREYELASESPSLSHLFGYMGRVGANDLKGDYQMTDMVGRAGLEKYYESEMRGTYAKKLIEVDATGRTKKVVADTPGVPGRSLVMSLDSAFQRDVESILGAKLKSSGKKRASVIVMNPNNGDLLALVSWPAYDVNDFSRGMSTEQYRKLADDPDRPLFPRATSGLLPSGSTFKPVVAAAALTEGFITAATTVLSTGGLRVGRWYFPDWKAGGHGATNVTKALAESVNSFFYVIGGGHEDYPNIKPLGADLIAEYARRFGFGAPTGIDLPSEGSGFIPTPEWKEQVRGEKWYIGDTYHFAIGQGDLIVTPLQVARMTAAFANGGDLVEPRLVTAVTGADGITVKRPVVTAHQVVPASSVEIVRRGMRQTVTSGSARSFNTLPWTVAAKTGTAQWNSRRENHAWFTSFAPYEKPEIVVTVVVEEGGEGSQIAAPIAKAIYERYFTGRLWNSKDQADAAAAAGTAAEATASAPVVTPAGLDNIGRAAP
jgi:penicillin-binding protein 2